MLIHAALALLCLAAATGQVRPAHALCGDVDDNGSVLASDALAILQTAVGIETACVPCVCDTNNSGTSEEAHITVVDALQVLKYAINVTDPDTGELIALTCPACASDLTCDSGYEANDADTACVDVDECTDASHECTSDAACVNTDGSYVCGIDCTQAAFEAALAECGGDAKTIVFGCTDQTITISNTGNWEARKISCDGLTIDGSGRNIVFDLDPPCFGDSADVAVASECGDGESDGFLRLLGDGNTVRDLTLRYFQEGIKTKGDGNSVESVTFVRHCAAAMSNDEAGSGNLFKDVTVSDGCATCVRFYGDKAGRTVTDPEDAYYNAVLDGAVLVGCQRPLLVKDGGRFLIRNSEMKVSDESSTFTCKGPIFTTIEPDYTTVVYMNDTSVSDCSQGVKVSGAGTTEAVFVRNTITDCTRRGILVKGTARLSLRQTTVRNNGEVGATDSDGGIGGVVVEGTASADLGGGTLLDLDGQTVSSPGGNVICGNLGGDGEPNDVENGLDDSSTSLAAIQTDIFTPKCATQVCHGSAGQPPRLANTSQSSQELVGVGASGCSDKIFVVAGDSSASYLLDKLGTGASYCGSAMPLGATALTSDETSLITAWIASLTSIPAQNNYWCGQDASASVTGLVTTEPELDIEPSCGDGEVVANVEECDDGNSSNLDECTNPCLDADCGDGYTQADVEQCDDANDDNTDACVSLDSTGDGAIDTYCRTAVCGDGHVRIGVETCDDGGESATCNSDCTASSCGDGVVNTTDGEACDSGGVTNADCNSDCTASSCGDGVVNSAAGEECDDGTANSDTAADACRVGATSVTTACTVASCGDGVRDTDETCDDGDANSNTEVNACRENCKAARCRDGVLDTDGADGAEECDDGNGSNTDGCLKTCVIASCGDGYIHEGAEACDNGTANSDTAADACRVGATSVTTACTAASCGDGVVDTDEPCDDGTANSNTEVNACRTTCQLAACGDGVVDPNGLDGAESCDDGTANSDDTAGACRTDCYLPTCMDGVTDPLGTDGLEGTADDETCDDGNPFDIDACTTSCLVAACGDGYVQKGTEACDDGNTTDGDGCSAGCVREQCLTIGGTQTCEACSTGGVLTQVCAADPAAACTSDADCGSCSDVSYTTQTDCETSLATWTVDSCSDDSYTTQTDCETSLATWTAGSCSDGAFTTQAACEAPRGDWTAGSCSDGAFTTQAACEAPRGDWTADSCTSARCLCDSGYTAFAGQCWDTTECISGHDCGDCSDSSYSTKTTCEAAVETWTLDSSKCVQFVGGYSCRIPCTADAFDAALADCGGTGGIITFDCEDTTIKIPAPHAPSKWGTRQIPSTCNNLIIDGLDDNITFELDPQCADHFEQFIAAGAKEGICDGGGRDGLKCDFSDCSTWFPSDDDCNDCDGGDCVGDPYAFSDGTSTTDSGACTETERGTGFLRLRGDNNIVRNLTVQHFYEGLQVHGSYNLVENVDFSHMCDDGPGSTTGKGNVFRDFTISEGCDKCIQNEGDVDSLGSCSDSFYTTGTTCTEADEIWTDETDESSDDYYHAIFDNITTVNCSKPFRMSGGGRFKIMDSEMKTEGDHAHCKGPLFSLTTTDYDEGKRSVVYIEDTIVDNCQEGIGFSGTAEGILHRNTVTNCGRRGVLVTKNSRISMTGNIIRFNGGETSSEKGFGGVAAWDNDNDSFLPHLDLGGGSIEIDRKTVTSDGFNVICDNVYVVGLKFDVHNLSEASVTAINNWWGDTDPSDQTRKHPGDIAHEPVMRRAPWWLPDYTTQATCEAAAGTWDSGSSSCRWCTAE